MKRKITTSGKINLLLSTIYSTVYILLFVVSLGIKEGGGTVAAIFFLTCFYTALILATWAFDWGEMLMDTYIENTEEEN